MEKKKEKLRHTLWRKVGQVFKKILFALLNPHFLLCFFTAWMITNGWSYVFLGLGALFHIKWMTAIGGAYLGLLWLPFTPEKILTCFISIGLLRWWFPKDEKTLLLLREMFHGAKEDFRHMCARFRAFRLRRRCRRLYKRGQAQWRRIQKQRKSGRVIPAAQERKYK